MKSLLNITLKYSSLFLNWVYNGAVQNSSQFHFQDSTLHALYLNRQFIVNESRIHSRNQKLAKTKVVSNYLQKHLSPMSDDVLSTYDLCSPLLLKFEHA
ncbi:hypothetical protein [Mariniflexile sp.]|uniref:hypothetical protein n=1 Tax=Mariniflexile sp. TaxID=1979402 RepID=UPI00356B361A